MIIVDGPDGSGKSTLLEYLRLERRSFKALRGGVGSDGQGNWGGKLEAPVAYAQAVAKALNDERFNPPGSDAYGTCVGFDRFHLSETVYGPILRQGSGITRLEVTILQRLLKARGIPVILCMPPLDVTLDNAHKEGRPRPEYQTDLFLRRAYDAWGRVAAQPRLYTTLYDYKRTPRLEPDCLRLPRCPEGVLGDPSARFLVVGHRSNADALGLPFFSADQTRSAGFFNAGLWYAGLREEHLAFTNAYTAAGAERDIRASLLATTEFIVAVGPDASEAVTRQRVNLPTLTVPDPRFWLRTHGKDIRLYAGRLAELTKV